MFPEAKPSGTLRVEGKQDSLFPEGPLIKCIVKASAKARNGVSCCAMLADVCKRSQQVATCWVFR